MKALLAIVSVLLLPGCANSTRPSADGRASLPLAAAPAARPQALIHNTGKVIHVLVALCDNDHQGLVPVTARIGNADDSAHNLYWGAGFGVKTYFAKSRNWQLVSQTPGSKPAVLERLVFKHKAKAAWIVADAYRGSEMKQT